MPPACINTSFKHPTMPNAMVWLQKPASGRYPKWGGCPGEITYPTPKIIKTLHVFKGISGNFCSQLTSFISSRDKILRLEGIRCNPSHNSALFKTLAIVFKYWSLAKNYKLGASEAGRIWLKALEGRVDMKFASRSEYHKVKKAFSTSLLHYVWSQFSLTGIS